MDIGSTLTLVDAAGNSIADLQATSDADDWYTGRLLSQYFTPQLTKALQWYDEVVENQMLSYLDQALAEVERFALSVRFANGTTRKVYSLHVSKNNEVSFRTSPVPPPVWLAQSESA